MKKRYFPIIILILCGFLTCIFIFVIMLSQNKKMSYNDENNRKYNNKQNNSQTSQKAYFYPYTGEKCDKLSSEKTAFMAIVENSADARPQSGLSEADVVFETMAEGGIPRFIVLFQKNAPKCIGPIRSARPYFVDISLEYKLPFVHCGGSEEALDIIEKSNLMSLNEMKYGAFFYRDNSRKAPHNLYTSSDKIKELIKQKNYPASSEKLDFNQDYWKKSSSQTADKIIISPNRYYSTSYEYKNQLYYKSMDGKSALDKNNNTQLAVENIVIQLTNITLQTDNSHLNIALTGSGDGYVISNGKYKKIKWYKSNKDSRTTIKDENGDTVFLSPGRTFWHILDKSSKVNIES